MQAAKFGQALQRPVARLQRGRVGIIGPLVVGVSQHEGGSFGGGARVDLELVVEALLSVGRDV